MCCWAFYSTANSTLATDQLRSLPSCMELEKFCKAAPEALGCSLFSSIHNASPHQSDLRTCPWWCHLAPLWRLCCKVLQQCTDSTWPGNSTLFSLLHVKSLAYPIFWAAMPCSRTLKRRASRSTTGCRKEERSCGPPPAFPGPHCWVWAKSEGCKITADNFGISGYWWHIGKHTVATVVSKILLE